MNKNCKLNTRFVKAAMCVAVAFSASASQATPIVLNNAGFETNGVGQGYQYLGGQILDGWSFAGNAGVAGNNSGFNVANAPGNQAAFLQQAGSSISQAFTFAGGLLSVDFFSQYRFYYGGNTVEVSINDQLLTFNGATSFSPWSDNMFTQYTTDAISLAAGDYVLKFTGTDGSHDYTTFIDNVSVNAVPEPGSLALLAAGVLAAAGLRRRRRA